MSIAIEFLSLPNVARMVGAKTITIDFAGQTVEQLISEVARKYGSKVERFLLDENGQLDMMLKVLRNSDEWIRSDQMQKPLEDGDHITIMLLAAGG
jgi:molybdopterin converting factor small subunit